jgi:hypothetical protein
MEQSEGVPVVVEIELPAQLAAQIEDNRAHPERRRPRDTTRRRRG